MSKESENFYTFVNNTFNVDGAAARIIHNILCFVDDRYTSNKEKVEILWELLDGTIGIEKKEIEHFYL